MITKIENPYLIISASYETIQGTLTDIVIDKIHNYGKFWHNIGFDIYNTPIRTHVKRINIDIPVKKNWWNF